MWNVLANVRRCVSHRISKFVLERIENSAQSKNFNIRRLADTKCEPTVYESRIAVPTDYEFVLKFMCETYFKSEPSIVNIGLASQETPPVLIDLMNKQIKDGLSLIILDEQGCIIGAAVNCGMAKWDPAKLRKIAACAESKDVGNLLRFYATIAEKPNLWETYHVNKVFECSCVAVEPQHQGVGIATKLIKDSWMLARDIGCNVFRIDCSSKYTAKIAEKLGWQCVASIPYSSHVDCDEFVFKNIRKPHDTLNVYIDLPLKANECS